MSSLHPHRTLLPPQATIHPLLPNRLPSHRLRLHLRPTPAKTHQMTLLPRPTLPVERRLLVTRPTLLLQIMTDSAPCPASRSRSTTQTRPAACIAASVGTITTACHAGMCGQAGSAARLRKRLSRWKMQMDALECELSFCVSWICPTPPGRLLTADPSSTTLETKQLDAHSLEDHLRATPAMIRAMLCSSLRQGATPAEKWSSTPGGLAGSAMVVKGLEEDPYMAEALLRSETVRFEAIPSCPSDEIAADHTCATTPFQSSPHGALPNDASTSALGSVLQALVVPPTPLLAADRPPLLPVVAVGQRAPLAVMAMAGAALLSTPQAGPLRRSSETIMALSDLKVRLVYSTDWCQPNPMSSAAADFRAF